MPTPAGRYLPAVRCGDLVFTAGMTPRRDDKLAFHGPVGTRLDAAAAAQAAALAANNALSAAAAGAGGLDNIASVIRLTVFVTAELRADVLTEVADGAQQAIQTSLGPAAAGLVRTVVGLTALPGGAPVEVELVATVATGA